ncbi:hypothetical protein GGF40_002480 [Coemansia sp. RSA 1286]|nr:hypothetical protein GGF40_002480 [Coemansia sp. RSA 1286]
MLRNHIAALEDCVEFVFLTAPNTARPYDIDGMDSMARITAIRSGKAVARDMRCWYQLKSAEPEIVSGLERSFGLLNKVLAEQGPFDGVFGFSQGGLMAALLSSLLEHRSPVLGSSHPALKFAIISSGYKLQDANWIHLYEKPISTPSLHIFGVLDGMITLNRSMELRDCFVLPEEMCVVGADYSEVLSNFVFLDPFSESGESLTQNVGSNHQRQDSQSRQQYASTPVLVNEVTASNNGAYFVGGPMLPNSAYATGTPMMVDSHHQISMNLSAASTLAAASTGGAVGSERNRSPSSTRSVSSIDHAQRRATHNAIERARRESLNGQFQDLASAVPALIHVRRPSKATIVEKSLEYIRSFKEHLGNRDQYIKKLQLRNLALHDEVNRLRKQLGLEPLSEAGEGEATLPLPDDIVGRGNAGEDKKGGASAKSSSPLKSVIGVMSVESPGAPTRSLIAEQRQKQQQQQQQMAQHKRRQQSLDLSISDMSSGGRPSLRVQTGKAASKHTSNISPVGSSNSDSGSAGDSPLHLSPLSAPILTTHAPQLPLVGAGANFFMNNLPNSSAPSVALGSSGMSIDTSNPSAAAAAAAAAFVAHTNAAHQQQALAVMSSVAPMAQFGSVMSMDPSMQVSAMGYMTHGHAGAMGVLDMNKLNEVFAVSAPSTAVASMSLMATSSDMSDAPLASSLPGKDQC